MGPPAPHRSSFFLTDLALLSRNNYGTEIVKRILPPTRRAEGTGLALGERGGERRSEVLCTFCHGVWNQEALQGERQLRVVRVEPPFEEYFAEYRPVVAGGVELQTELVEDPEAGGQQALRHPELVEAADLLPLLPRGGHHLHCGVEEPEEG